MEPIKNFIQEIIEKDIHVYRKEYVEEHKKHNDYFGHGIYCGTRESPGFKSLHKASKLISNVKIFYEVHPEKCKEFDIKEGQLAYYKKSNLKVVYDEFENFAKLKQFLNFARFDVINDFTVDVVGETIGSKIPMLVFFDPSSNRELLGVLEDLHPKIQFNFVIVHNKNKEEFERQYVEVLGASESNFPELMIVLMQKKTVKFKYNGPFVAKQILQFLLDFLHHKLDQHLISEKEDENHHKKFLKTVTAQGFRTLLEDKQRDKIILFHTETCHKCPEAVEMLEELAKELQGQYLYFGKFNVAKNEGPEITKIPSLVFFPKDDSKIDYFQGGLDREAIKKFILDKHNRTDLRKETDL